MNSQEFYQLLFQLTTSLYRCKLISIEEKGLIKDEIVQGDLSNLIKNIRKTISLSKDNIYLKMVESIKNFVELQRQLDVSTVIGYETSETIQSSNNIETIWELQCEEDQEDFDEFFQEIRSRS